MRLVPGGGNGHGDRWGVLLKVVAVQRKSLIRRISAWVAVVVAATAVATAGLAVPAQAATVVWQGQLVNFDYEDKCLSANFNNDVYTTLCSGVIYHQWKLMSDGQLINAGTGNCLSSNPNGTIYTVAASTCATNTEWHTWAKAYYTGNLTLLKNNDSRLCLSTNDADVYGTSCDTFHDSQFWWWS